MGIKFANKASTSLTSGINSSATSIDVADGSVFPALGINDHFFATLQFLNDSSETEVIKVTAVSGNTLTVDRTIETPKSFSANDIIELRVTSQALADPTLLAEGVKLEDGHKIQLGDSDDLQIYHDGSDSFIKDTGAGDLYIQGSEVTLKRGEDTKLNTTLDGVQVTGRIDATDIDLTGTILSDAFKSDGESTDYSVFSRVNTTHPAIYVQSTGTKIASFATGSVLPNGGTEVLDVNSTGIDVTGTVAASDGLTADYIDLTGGESTTTTGTVACTLIKLADPSTPASDQHLIYTEADSVGSALSNLVIHAGDDTHEKVILRVGNNSGGHVDVLKATGSGVDIASSLEVTGTVTADGVSLGDNEKIQLGASGDLKIYHNGSHSKIEDTGTGNLVIEGNEVSIKDLDGNRRVFAESGNSGSARLYYGTDSTEKLATTAAGINVTGTVTADGVSLEAGDKLIFGAEANSSLQIYEDDDGGKSRIAQYGGGDLWVQGENISLRNDDAETLIATGHTQAHMYWQGDTGTKGERFRTTATGIDVTGKVECKDTVAITTTGSGTDPAPDLDFINLHDDAIGERLGQINYYGMNDESGTGSGQTKYAWTEVRTIDVTEDSEKAQHETWLKNGANHTRVLTVEPTGIDVTGTVTADLLTLHPTGGTNEGGQINFQRDVDDSNAWYVDVFGSTTDTKMRFVNVNDSLSRLEIDDAGIDVTGVVEADAFTGHMTSVVSSSAQTIATTNYGVRKIHTGSAVTYTFNETGAIAGNDIGKAIVIANAGTDTITCTFTTSKFYKMISGVDADLSGSGASSITIAKGGIAEIVITETDKALVFGAGVA